MQSLVYYTQLVQKIDAFTSMVVQTYNNLQCKEGCSYCCILESIMPVELVPIIIWYDTQPAEVKEIILHNTSSSCLFLHNTLCLVYPYRPIICRTHGYPILIDTHTDVCPLNAHITFSLEHTLNLENVNTMLAAINILFIKEVSVPALQQERIYLRSFFQCPESDILSIVHALKGY